VSRIQRRVDRVSRSVQAMRKVVKRLRSIAESVKEKNAFTGISIEADWLGARDQPCLRRDYPVLDRVCRSGSRDRHRKKRNGRRITSSGLPNCDDVRRCRPAVRALSLLARSAPGRNIREG